MQVECFRISLSAEALWSKRPLAFEGANNGYLKAWNIVQSGLEKKKKALKLVMYIIFQHTDFSIQHSTP